MARTRKEIKAQITQAFMSNSTMANLYGFAVNSNYEEQFSLVSFENILFEILAYILMFHEQIVDKNAENSRPHTISWYRTQVLNFVDGLPLIWTDGQFDFDYGILTPEEILERKVVKKCAIEEQASGSLMIKVSGEEGPIEADELVRLQAYMKQVKDAGNKLRFRNAVADDLKITLTVYVDPLIIDLETGELLDQSETIYPVKDAIYGYLNNLEFNGAFVRTKFIDAIQLAEGVQDVHISVLQHKFGGNSFSDVGRYVVPYAGYFTIGESDLNITYLPNDLD